MTLLADQNLYTAMKPGANELTVWGYSATALHDLFWLSREVAIVRPGAGKPIAPDARLFLLVPEGKLFRLHLRLVLDQLFWMPRAMYFIGFHPPTRSKRAADAKPSSPVADQGAVSAHESVANRNGKSHEPAARAALTPHRDIAEYWNTIHTAGNVWMALRRHYPDFGSIKVPGIAYEDTGCQAMGYLQALARDWPDPDAAIAGISRLAHRVYGPTCVDISMLKAHTRPLWIGHGRDSDNTAASCGILPDAVPAGKPDELPSERK